MELAPHFWTLAPRLAQAVRPLPLLESREFGFTVEDPKIGPVKLSGRLRERPGDDLLVLLHGLGGYSGSQYMLRGAQAAEQAGLSCLRLDMRGSDLRGEDFYHAALTADLHAALRRPELSRFRRIYVLGYSVGGHVALRYAAEPGDPRVRSVAALCSPLQLAPSSAAFDRPGRWFYRRYILRNLLRIYTAVAARRPVPLPVAEVARIRSLREFDERVVAPRHDFTGADDYYARASAGPHLADLRVPSLLLAVERDPMVPGHTVRSALHRELPRLTVRWLARGGHVGFPRDPGLDLAPDHGPEIEAQTIGWLRGQR